MGKVARQRGRIITKTFYSCYPTPMLTSDRIPHKYNPFPQLTHHCIYVDTLKLGEYYSYLPKNLLKTLTFKQANKLIFLKREKKTKNKSLALTDMCVWYRDNADQQLFLKHVTLFQTFLQNSSIDILYVPANNNNKNTVN